MLTESEVELVKRMSSEAEDMLQRWMARLTPEGKKLLLTDVRILVDGYLVMDVYFENPELVPLTAAKEVPDAS